MISESELADAVEKTFPLVEQLSAEGVVITEFEYVNALEFYIHAKAKCDVVVLETGMGGLLDCTNVIKPPLCSVITTIGLDHTAVLGDTIEKITQQKCGIIKSGSMAVTSVQEQAVMSIIEQIARDRKIPLAKSENVEIEVVSQQLDGSVFIYNNTEINLSLAGAHQIENAKTALAVIEMLRLNGLLSVTDTQIVEGFANAVNPARLELMSKEPVILLDGAHNPNGIEALKNAVQTFLKDKYVIGIMGMLADKDIDSSLKLLEGVFNTIYTVPVNNPRALSSSALATKCARFFDDVKIFETPQHAVDVALEQAKKAGFAVVVCGSLYLAGEIRPYIQQIINN